MPEKTLLDMSDPRLRLLNIRRMYPLCCGRAKTAVGRIETTRRGETKKRGGEETKRGGEEGKTGRGGVKGWEEEEKKERVRIQISRCLIYMRLVAVSTLDIYEEAALAQYGLFHPGKSYIRKIHPAVAEPLPRMTRWLPQSSWSDLSKSGDVMGVEQV